MRGKVTSCWIYMGHLRQKLELDPAQPRHLLAETAVGYRLPQEP